MRYNNQQQRMSNNGIIEQTAGGMKKKTVHVITNDTKRWCYMANSDGIWQAIVRYNKQQQMYDKQGHYMAKSNEIG